MPYTAHVGPDSGPTQHTADTFLSLLNRFPNAAIESSPF